MHERLHSVHVHVPISVEYLHICVTGVYLVWVPEFYKRVCTIVNTNFDLITHQKKRKEMSKLSLQDTLPFCFSQKIFFCLVSFFWGGHGAQGSYLELHSMKRQNKKKNWEVNVNDVLSCTKCTKEDKTHDGNIISETWKKSLVWLDLL